MFDLCQKLSYKNPLQFCNSHNWKGEGGWESWERDWEGERRPCPCWDWSVEFEFEVLSWDWSWVWISKFQFEFRNYIEFEEGYIE